MAYRQYIDLNTIYPQDRIETDTYYIDTVILDKTAVMMEMMRNSDNYWMVRGLKPDFKYKRLVLKGKGVMMSDTPMERNTNREFLTKANGDVIVFGLGLGLIILPLLSDPTIKSIRVVELDQSLIYLVTPILKKYDNENKLTVVQGDCFKYVPEKGSKFDTVYFDIWISISDDNYEEQKKLERGFRKYLNKENPISYIDSWMKSYYQKERIKERRRKNAYRDYGWII